MQSMDCPVQTFNFFYKYLKNRLITPAEDTDQHYYHQPHNPQVSDPPYYHPLHHNLYYYLHHNLILDIDLTLTDNLPPNPDAEPGQVIDKITTNLGKVR